MDERERNHPFSLVARPLIYAITGPELDLDGIELLAAAGVDLIQIRAKRLAAGSLFDLCRRARILIAGRARMLVNDRLDVALAAGADGVHLPADGLAPGAVRRVAPSGFLIGASCHSVPEVEALARLGSGAGPDFCVLGPIFDTPSKRAFGPPLGLAALRATQGLGLPVLALGGVSPLNAPACLRAGAAGLAAIGMFQVEPRPTVRRLREIGKGTTGDETA